MIKKITLNSIINKYYLGLNESVKWVVKDKNLTIEFMTPTKDVIGRVTHSNFDIEDCELAIYDTKKLVNLLYICFYEVLIELEKIKSLFTKLKISDKDFDVSYALADPLLIPKVGTVKVPEWDIELELKATDVDNLIKAKTALTGVDNMFIETFISFNDEKACSFIFGNDSGHNSNVTYQVVGKINNENIRIPFNSEMFKLILQANKDMDGGKIFISEKGLMKFEFEKDGTYSEYFQVRLAESNF